jgi:hypothetical protein
VQGILRNEKLLIRVDTTCANSGRALEIEFDQDLNVSDISEGADPMVSIPLANLTTIEEPSIVDVF